MGEFKPVVPGADKKEERKNIEHEGQGLVDIALDEFQGDKALISEYLNKVFNDRKYPELRENIDGIRFIKNKKGKESRVETTRNYTEIFLYIKNAFWRYFDDTTLDNYRGQNKEQLQKWVYEILDEKNNYSVSEMKDGKERLFNKIEKVFFEAWEEYKTNKEREASQIPFSKKIKFSKPADELPDYKRNAARDGVWENQEDYE